VGAVSVNHRSDLSRRKPARAGFFLRHPDTMRRVAVMGRCFHTPPGSDSIVSSMPLSAGWTVPSQGLGYSARRSSALSTININAAETPVDSF
jgi:hypothetical protein